MTAGIALATCIGCGCDDHHACPGGCSWARVDYGAAVGVCSSCEDYVDQWDDGRRDLDLPQIHFWNLLLAMMYDNNYTFRATPEQAQAGRAAIERMIAAGAEFPTLAAEISHASCSVESIYWRIAAGEYTAMHTEFDGFDGFTELNQVLETIFNSQA